jgi:hypothetical protein
MGSTTIYSDKTFSEVFSDQFKSDNNWTLLKSSQKGNINYSVWDTITKSNECIRTVLITIFSRENGRVSFKDIDISGGPYYYDIPATLFKLLKSGNVSTDKYTSEWIETVENNQKIGKLKTGSTFIMTGYGDDYEGEKCYVYCLQKKYITCFKFGYTPLRFKGFRPSVHVASIISI